jgi:cupin 2 domain-containing protein
MTVVRRGRLHGAGDVPTSGERHLDLTALDGVRVQEILSGAVAEPMRFRSDEHEWVVVLAGSARLELDGEVHRLSAGDWLVIPAGTPHTVDGIEPGTRWLAVLVPLDSP